MRREFMGSAPGQVDSCTVPGAHSPSEVGEVEIEGRLELQVLRLYIPTSCREKHRRPGTEEPAAGRRAVEQACLEFGRDELPLPANRGREN